MSYKGSQPEGTVPSVTPPVLVRAVVTLIVPDKFTIRPNLQAFGECSPEVV